MSLYSIGRNHAAYCSSRVGAAAVCCTCLVHNHRPGCTLPLPAPYTLLCEPYIPQPSRDFPGAPPAETVTKFEPTSIVMPGVPQPEVMYHPIFPHTAPTERNSNSSSSSSNSAAAVYVMGEERKRKPETRTGWWWQRGPVDTCCFGFSLRVGEISFTDDTGYLL